MAPTTTTTTTKLLTMTSPLRERCPRCGERGRTFYVARVGGPVVACGQCK